ncbi:MAG: hypothetical protein EXX96DRAFT_592502 [Benjaminiella poitrasii]|nr:MAG: hypothetical protein EXX96DRAFT_592502 [Benjaminiella poitrasii]
MSQQISTAPASDDSMGSTPVTPSQLKTFLAETPLMYKNRLHKGAKKHILTNCYRSLWSNDLDLMQKYFFKEGLSDSDNLSQLLEKYNLFGSEQHDHDDHQHSNQQNLSINNDDEPEYWESQRGKQCGHLFKKGESVYRCRNCGLDDTCVMCSKCFHSTNHDGHDVKIWISRGAGGCCDCGDPEAWKIPLECSIHSLNAASNIPDSSSSMSTQRQLEPLSSVPQSIIDSLRDTITVVFDYILETFATSPEDVVAVGTAESIRQDCRDSHQALNLPVNAPNQTYACVLWNDEKHSFDAVINIVCEAIGCTKDEAAHCAECVDEYGRHIVKESTDIDELIRIADTISSINLAVTICSSQKTLREEIAGLLLDWLKDLTGGRYKFFSHVEGGSSIIRDIICEVLSEDWALRPELAWLSIRYRRERMPEDEDDEFDLEGADTDMGEDDEDEDEIMFGEEINEEEILLDEDDLFENSNEEGSDDEEEMPVVIEQSSEMDTDGDVAVSTESSASRRRQSDAPSRHQADTNIMSSSQGRHAEALKRRRLSSSTHKPRDILDMEWNLDTWLEYTEKLEVEERVLAQQLGIPIESTANDIVTTHRLNANLKKEFKRKLRLDYLLQFDLRLWKTARVSIKDLLIGTFISNFQYRPVLGTRFARNYPELVDAFFFKDREPENSISTLSVQLLTVPTVASMLVKEYKFFGIVCTILENFFLTDHIHMTLPEEYSRAQVDCSSRAIGRHRYAYTIFDLRYVMNAEQVKAEILRNPLYLRHFIDMLYQFQEMDPLQRKADTHVEFESQSWVTAFNMTLQTSKLCRLFAGCFGSSEVDVSDASRNLCRSIYRVLREIAEWNPVLVSRKDDNETLSDTRVKINGLKDQKFHQINTPNAGAFEIVEFDITKNPVSFHHPFHWLLSELFENVSLLHPAVLCELGWLGGFKQMVDDAFEDKKHDMFLMILEYPIRTIALLAQISCGVWVRNGYNIRNQAHSYRDVNVRESTLDCDIYLLQVGLTVCDSNQILLTLMDRFQLVEWFRGKADKSSVYDASQMNYMVEEFLNLLIICVTEHGYASGTTIEQRIRQYIIQFLGISSMAYSELLKLIPESLTEHESFESQLNQIANFKAPDGLNDRGLYEIKPEYLDEIDPYHWHYTRNQREEAQAVLKKRWNQLNPDNKLSDKEEFLLIPKVKRIEVGPFRHLGQFLHSHVLCQIIAYALWDAKFNKETKNDTMLDEALYLGMLAVTDPNSPSSELAAMKMKGKYRADVLVDESTCTHFVNFAEKDSYSIQINEIEKTHASLLLILLRCLDDAELSHAHKRLQFIVDKIEGYGSAKAKEQIAEWKERKSIETKAKVEREGENSTSEYEKKKAAAKARQAAIMSQFAKAQSQFMEKHAGLYKIDDEDEDEEVQELYEEVATMKDELGSENELEVVRKCYFPADNCIVCQEELDDNNLFGMLGLIQQSNLHRLIPMNNTDVMADILESSRLANPWVAAKDEKENDKPFSFAGFPTEAHVPGLDISSCGHLMHADCFETYQKSVESQLLGEFGRTFPFAVSPKSRFLCPLCKALGNVLVPIVWKGKTESFPGAMAPSSDYAGLTKSMKDAAEDLRKNFEHIPGAFDEDVPFVNNDPNLVIKDKDRLKQIYNQLMKVMHVTMEKRPVEHPLNLPDSLLSLYDMYAYTIANFEIAQRGIEGTRARDLTVEHTGTFIDDVSNTSQMLLKILGMTNNLIRDLMNTPWQAEDRFTRERLALQAISQLLPETTAGLVDDVYKAHNLKTMLIDDPFRVLVRMSFAISDIPSIEIHHVLRTIYITELTRIVISLAQGILNGDRILKDAKILQFLKSLNQDKQQMAGTESIQRFTNYVLELLNIPSSSIKNLFDVIQPGAFVSLIRFFALPFLRKSLLFMVVCHGFIPQNPSDDMEEKYEFENILDILRLPGLDTALDLQSFEQNLVKGWCEDYMKCSSQLQQIQDPVLSISLNLPTQYQLTSLPYRLDELLDESSKRVCRKCKTVPEHSAICLICGTFVCARRFCCTEGTKGECNTHMKR